MPGSLYIIATPIGNMEDITLRALRILKEIDILACENTRNTQKLLRHYEIHVPQLVQYFSQSSQKQHDQIIKALKEGKKVGLVTDAGTPLVSDPGIKLLRDVHNIEGVEVVSIPGPSSLTSFLSISPLESQKFTFLGFIPTKKGRQTWFESLTNFSTSIVCFESSHRIIKTLQTLYDMYPEARLSLGKELTKLHERVITGSPDELLDAFKENERFSKGEFVLQILL